MVNNLERRGSISLHTKSRLAVIYFNIFSCNMAHGSCVTFMGFQQRQGIDTNQERALAVAFAASNKSPLSLS